MLHCLVSWLHEKPVSRYEMMSVLPHSKGNYTNGKAFLRFESSE